MIKKIGSMKFNLANVDLSSIHDTFGGPMSPILSHMDKNPENQSIFGNEIGTFPTISQTITS